MPLYTYKAVSASGSVIDGQLEARSESAAVERLQEMGHLPVRIQEAAAPTTANSPGLLRRGRISRDAVMQFTRELSTLLHAGLALDRCLEIMIGMATTPEVMQLLMRIQADVRGGSSLSGALEAHKAVFDRFYLNMVRAGEASGALDLVLLRITEFMDRSKELKDTVTSAMIYPAILVFVAVASVLLLLMFVVPQFTQMFAQSGQALPVPTQVVIAAGEFVRRDWWVLLLVTLIVTRWLRAQFANPVSRYRWDRWALGTPLLGELLLKLDVARLTRTLGMLLGNGVVLLPALAIAKETMTNTVLARALDQVGAELREGRGLGRPLQQTGLFPKLAVHMMMVGEETGRLEDLLMQVAGVYDREVQSTIKRLLALMEPLLILGLGLVIGGIIMSILLAILSVNNLAFS